MDSQEQQQQIQTVSIANPYLLRLRCFLCQALNPNINDENNNLKKTNNSNEKSFNPISKLPLYTCPDCEAKIRLDEKESASISTVTSQELEEESDRMIIVPDTSSEENDDECWCQSCRNDDDDSRQYWEDLSHIIKCVYRATDKQFQDNQFSADISKAKDYVKILTDLNPQMLFNRLESIVLEYVREIRQQVSERFHTCAKTSPDVQLFISFLLDEYQMFIQAATNVSMIISYLEDNYIKSFHLTWLLYNKHLYEKFIYMDRKIQHSMSTMIDLLQPSNDDEEDNDDNDDNCDNKNKNTYSSSPSEYTQLLNRLLAFDEEMSEIACLYKNSQAKLISQPLHVCNRNEYSSDKSIKQNKKKKKSKKNKKSKKFSDDNSTSIPMDITSVSAHQGSNGSSIGSGHCEDESSSASSFDDYLLDNETCSSGYTQEEQEELTRLILEDDFEEQFNQQLLKDIFESVSPLARIQHQINLDDNDQWIGGIFQGVRSQSNKNETNEQPTTTTTAATTVSTTSKPSESSSTKKSSSKSKSNKSSHRRKESSTHAQPTNTTTQLPKKSIPSDLFLPRSIADLSAKIQSVSFTAGTFGSITSTNPNEIVSSSSTATTSSSPTNCSTTTTLTAAKTTTSTGQTRLSINLTRKPGSKTEHGGQKIAEALFNELTSLGNGECSNNGRKKDNQQFKKTKQQPQRSTINETLPNSSSTTTHSFFNSSNKSDMNSSSTTALHNLDHLLRHAASNADVSEATLHSIISSLHSPTCHDSSSKTTEKFQALLAQQQHFHHHQQQQQQQQKKHFSPNQHCEFCCCEFSEGRRCSSTAACLHLSSNTTNGPITSCVTCMALPGSATTTTTSVMGTAIAGVFNQRDVERKERLKLKLNRRNVQSCTEQQNSNKDQTKKSPSVTKKPTATIPNTTTPTTQTNSKSKDVLLNDKNNIDDLVRFIDGDEKTSTNHHEHQTSTTNGNETTSKKKKKKDKQSKNNEETKSNSSSQQQRGQTTNQKKQNGSNGNQQTTDSQQQSRSTSSSSTVTETQPPLSKRKQKAKLKLEQQQQQQEKQATDNTEKSATTTATTTDSDKTNVSTTPVPTTVPSSVPLVSSISNSSSQGTNSTRTDVDLPSENFDSPEEEVNWITISRKQGKHKPTPPSVPSLLAAPIPPVVSPLNSKPHRQQQPGTNNTKKNTTTTTNNSSLVQHKVMSNNVTPSNVTLENGSTNSNKQQHNTVAPPRLQNVLKNHASHQLQKVESIQPPVQPWSNNIHEHTPVIPPVASPSTLLPTASTYLPTPPVPVGGGPSILPSSMYWDPNVYLHSSSSSSSSPTRFMSSTAPGPVQRPNSSFSPAPGTVNNNNNTTTSRCIQRPSPEPRSCSTNSVSFPLYSPMNYAVGNSNSTWTDTSGTNTHGSQWNFPQEQQLGPSTPATDFPLYDPFHSGATLTIPSTVQTPLLNNGYPEHFGDFCGVPLDNDVNEMDALDKEIEDFKKFCFETVPLKPREKVQVNVDRCFVRQT